MRLRDEESGQVIVLVALFMTVMMMAGGLVIDVGNARQTAGASQSAADAAALAGASQLSSASTARSYAEEYAFDTLGVPRGSVVTCPSDAPTPGTTVCYQSSAGQMVYVTTPWSGTAADGSTPSSSNQINVKICASTTTTLSGLAGLKSIRSCKSSTAASTSTASSTLPCALCILSPTGTNALNLSGGTSLTIAGGSGVYVNSSQNSGSKVAASFSGSAVLNVSSPGTINVVGGTACTTGCTYQQYNATVNPAPTEGVTAISDPLASLVPPSVPGTATAVTVSNNKPLTITPGVYSSIKVSNSAADVLTMSPGTYVITGPFTVGNSASVYGNGVTLYFTCTGYSTANTAPCSSPGQTGGYFNANGATTSTLNAPTSGTYAGLVMFYDRNDYGAYNWATTDCGTDFVGASGKLTTTGTIYAADAQICITGAGLSLTSMIVAAAFEEAGSGNNTFTATPATQVSIGGTAGNALIG
jgi:Flp pilus assembly protein TadG